MSKATQLASGTACGADGTLYHFGTSSLGQSLYDPQFSLLGPGAGEPVSHRGRAGEGGPPAAGAAAGVRRRLATPPGAPRQPVVLAPLSPLQGLAGRPAHCFRQGGGPSLPLPRPPCCPHCPFLPLLTPVYPSSGRTPTTLNEDPLSEQRKLSRSFPSTSESLGTTAITPDLLVKAEDSRLYYLLCTLHRRKNKSALGSPVSLHFRILTQSAVGWMGFWHRDKGRFSSLGATLSGQLPSREILGKGLSTSERQFSRCVRVPTSASKCAGIK